MGRDVTNPGFQSRRDRAVEAMNRGHEAMHRNDRESLIAACSEYETAIADLRDLPLAENPGWANSLGAALMNRASLLHRIHGIERARETLAVFSEAMAVLSAIPVVSQPWAHRNLAGTLVNRANLLLDLEQPEAALKDAETALNLVSTGAATIRIDAEIAIKAQRTLCDALGQIIVQPGACQDTIADRASNVVDDALALVRLWKTQGETGFEEIGIRFFRFGAELYRKHQPQFLAEFVLENVSADSRDHDPFSREMRAIAWEELTQALRACDEPALYFTGDPKTERRLEIRTEIARTLERLSNRLLAG